MISAVLLIAMTFQMSGAQFTYFEADKPEEAWRAMLTVNGLSSRIVIVTDKPVYRNGEYIHVTVLKYNIFTKNPIVTSNFQGSVVNIFDGSNRMLGTFENVALLDPNPKQQDLVSQYHRFLIPKDFPGGFYRVTINNSSFDMNAYFFIFGYNARSYALIGDWNLVNVKRKDTLKGKITFKNLLSDQAPTENLVITYNFVSNGNLLLTQTSPLVNNQLNIAFTVPSNVFNSLVFSASVVFNGVTVDYKKEFVVVQSAGMFVEFNFASIKPVIGVANKVYFRAFDSSLRLSETAISKATLYKIVGTQTTLITQNIVSEEEGKGTFQLTVTQADVDNKATFVFDAQVDSFPVRRFTVLKTDTANFSPVHLALNDRVFKPDANVDLTFTTPTFRGNATLVVHEKTRLLFKKSYVFTSETLTDSLQISNWKFTQGGVLNIELFTDRLSNIVTTTPSSLFYKGQLQQDYLIFVEPLKYVEPTIQITSTQTPGGDVQYSIDMNAACPSCVIPANAYVLIDVVDESAYVETDRSMDDASLATKIFLENDVQSALGYTYNPSLYIDYLFSASSRTDDNRAAFKRRLDYLLGCQFFRALVFDPTILQDHILNRNKLARGYWTSIYKLLPFALKEFPLGGAEGVNDIINIAGDTYSGSNNDDEAQIIINDDVYTQLVKEDNIHHRKIDLWTPTNKLSGSFVFPLTTGTFRFIVTVVSDKGFYGYATKLLLSKADFDVIADVPISMLETEEFDLVMTIKSNINTPKTVRLRLEGEQPFDIPAKGQINKNFHISAATVPTKIVVEDVDHNELTSVLISPKLNTVGLEIVMGKSQSYSLKNTVNTPLELVAKKNNKGKSEEQRRREKKKTTAKACAQSSVLDLIQAAIKSFNTIPKGCMEQISSVLFVLIQLVILLLDLLAGCTCYSSALYQALLNLIIGTRRMVALESKDGGLDWFLSERGHSTLTAYGLLQLQQINNINLKTPLFSNSFIDRKVEFLKTQKNFVGGYNIKQGFEQFGNPDQNVSDGYITSIISKYFEKYGQDFGDEVSYVSQITNNYFESGTGLDPYRLILAGNVFHNMGDEEAVNRIVTEVFKNQDPSTGKINNAETSITRSSGETLNIETTARAGSLLLDANLPEKVNELNLALKYITQSLAGGLARTTQPTAVSMMFVNQFVDINKQQQTGSNTFAFKVGGHSVGELKGNFETADSKCLDVTAKFNENIDAEGDVEVPISLDPVQLTLSDRPIIVSFEVNTLETNPISSPNSPISLQIARKIVDNIYTYDIVIKNNAPVVQGMVTYIFSKPTALEFSMSDLQTLKMANEIDFFEIRNNNSQIVFYWKGMAANGVIDITVSLYKRFPTIPVVESIHMAYLYYNQDESSVYITPQ